MGERKRRIESFRSSVEPIVDYMRAYQHALRALLKSAPESRQIAVPEIATVGRVDVWPCSDGAVILIYRDEKIQINVILPISRNVNEFLQSGKAAGYYDQKGYSCQLKSFFKITDASTSIIHFAGNVIKEGDKEFRPKYQRAIIIGWHAQLPLPDEEAIKDFNAAFAAMNIVGAQVAEMSQQEVVVAVKTNTDIILKEFRELLSLAEREEDLQIYLKTHPEILYPDYIESHPKFKLGDDYVCDYVLKVQGQSGSEYVFVEIERPSKLLFTKSGQFSADLTQAKDQLLNWEKWLNINYAYVIQKLPGLYKPQFHLVMGRTGELSAEQIEKLRTEFSGTHRKFSTYDDLAERFEQIINQIVQRN